jgi:hypothetical protein
LDRTAGQRAGKSPFVSNPSTLHYRQALTTGTTLAGFVSLPYILTPIGILGSAVIRHCNNGFLDLRKMEKPGKTEQVGRGVWEQVLNAEDTVELNGLSAGLELPR